MKPKIIVVIGARPQFIKHFPFEKASENRLNLKTIHTGQHYDKNMSDIFFEQLGMNKPNYTLNIGSGNHGEQTGKMMIEIEKIIIDEKPDGIVVFGDTNSTLAGALVASKLHIPVFHIESGLRSYNKEMPEEINRILTDHVSNILFIPSEIASENLMKEGITQCVYNVGDIMKDLVEIVKKKGLFTDKKSSIDKYYYVTIHRPYNTDEKDRLFDVLLALNKLNFKVVMTLHPRTKNLSNKYQINLNSFTNIEFIEPQSYFDNLNYLYHSKGLITDSGGMQKEAYWLKKKCITIRKETEWIETLEFDANKLIFDKLSDIQVELDVTPTKWDVALYGYGNSADKIVTSITKYFDE
ncbi:non-hydrolyzing UDP-N-acetylglucosamine 2-epimerase [Hyunsoonleella pacifica]|uniref:UDP-N-acetylglucosamine 2-epimerase (Non-hydrolyzing) n=1 Tax=Hyunsoonleella pacifica TaxID=1080224 RepID=A0A4Q9FSX6_9FLAO|nr:UDP-N-acetylglucosamine 2-epimerase (non-hydrolyzing) [Hyunsoonleella pacifica]TBN16734.1 UDP-N-acetylglucosamine 2-epimerase (non-hydrolyzing) [Hyunsoonleella pacifica]GGD16907.1 UDP-N-acetyl glucosamine 2-epimerase [Hyunsoonleella pacifica]